LVEVPFQPLRIPPGWRVNWNTFFELDPTEDNVRAGFFGGSSLFAASNDHLRLAVDLEWRPEDDPAGQYLLWVLNVPWTRTENGRRRKGTPINWRDARTVYEFRAKTRAEIVTELEAALRSRPEWIEHS
jgi:hypothetical protein